jgi:hypothetical protein
MLCCEVGNKVLRTQTAYQLIKDVVARVSHKYVYCLKLLCRAGATGHLYH